MKKTSAFSDRDLLFTALSRALEKLHPKAQLRNPVMFSVYIGCLFVLLLFFQQLYSPSPGASLLFIGLVGAWLWLTVIFANFAEALAEGRGKAQADTLRNARSNLKALKITDSRHPENGTEIDAGSLRVGDLVYVQAGSFIPGDGEVIEGAASVDESAVTGESAPVIRQSGGDRSAVTGGTKVLSDWLVIRITTNPGDTFLDRMIRLVEGASRQRTPNEIALSILLTSLTLIFLLVCATLLPISTFSAVASGIGREASLTTLVALFVCLAPTTIGGLLSAIGIAGMDRLLQRNVIAMSGRAVEAAGDIDVLLLDKTGTITLGNREAVEFLPSPGVSREALARAAQLSSLADETPEGRSIVVLAKEKFGLREVEVHRLGATFVPFTAETRMSGVDLPHERIRKGAADSIRKLLASYGRGVPQETEEDIKRIAQAGGTPLLVANDEQSLGVIYLRDILKAGMKERFAELRRMGIKTIMVTGDNPLTAAAIAAESGVDDFLAEATPERKLQLIREYQKGGRLVAMTGDGTNDAPALAQADVAVAMNSGTQAAKEAGNLIDLDSNPTKLIEIVETGKQILMTRGSLTTFSIANDVAKYFAIIPAAFAATYPSLRTLDVMRLGSPDSAILSAVIFNALIIVALIPLALRGVKYQALSADEALMKNVLLYGLGGLVTPFIGIKAIDLMVSQIM